MKILCVIPSRIASTRLPNKPLLLIQGKPMIQWTYENASRCQDIDKIIVATDDQRVVDTVENCGGSAMLTHPNLQTGSDRVAAVAKAFPEYEVIINLQGDEPFIQPIMLSQLVEPFLKEEQVEMSTLAYPISEADYANPGAVKVITDQQNNAIYFSRAPIPYYRTNSPAPVFHHIGLYAFRRNFLLQYTTLPQTPLEITESLEQLRALENGHKIRVCLTEEKTLEINTPEEFEAAQKFFYTQHE